ncbi:metallophosphoesterase [Thiohalophilus sp.]|uniref:metallophosphoesterase n=1 Tax=Thiohalophilus sp. TaxID=3028392 RepID=UPI0039755847
MSRQQIKQPDFHRIVIKMPYNNYTQISPVIAMQLDKARIQLPRYHGHHWIRDGLPTAVEPWQLGKQQSIDKDRANHHALAEVLASAVSYRPWKWPKRTIFFLADPHADAEAFSASLVASGGIKKTGPDHKDFKLTKSGGNGTFIIGGDCLDKGPSNLQLLRSIRNLMDTGATVKLLAGNHDVRLLMGIRALGLKRHPTTEHLFLRMGPKVVPLLKEIHSQYLGKNNDMRGIPEKRECRRRLFPSKRWFDNFPKAAAWLMSEQSIERELIRMHKKLDSFENACKDVGLGLRDVYATAQKCRELFLKPRGEFYWFFQDMQLLFRSGSFLFIHAGLDDRVINLVEEESFAYLNRLFRKQIKNNLFEFYYGPLANTMRTKYREVDMPLTSHGVERIYRQGVHAVVHGHRNRTNGQRLMLRQGMIHIESDITMDRNSRSKEGLDSYGIGVTIIRPEGRVLGISTDHPYAKVFEPQIYFDK